MRDCLQNVSLLPISLRIPKNSKSVFFKRRALDPLNATLVEINCYLVSNWYIKYEIVLLEMSNTAIFHISIDLTISSTVRRALDMLTFAKICNFQGVLSKL